MTNNQHGQVPEAFLKSVIALCNRRGYSPANIEGWDKDDKWIADLWRQAESMLAASPTPPAEQQAAPKAAPVTQQAGYAEVIECGNLYAKVKLKGEAFGSTKVGDIFYTALQQEAQEPVAWLVPTLQTFKGAERVHFTRAPGRTMTDAELIDHMEGRVVWIAKTFSDSPGITDKFGVEHKPKPLYTAPQPAPLSEMPYEKRKAIQEGEQIGASDAWFKARHEMLDTVDRRNVFRAGFDRGWNAALAAQGGK